MFGKMKNVGTLLLLLAIPVVFVMPEYSVGPTVMPAARDAAVLFLSIVITAALIAEFRRPIALHFEAGGIRPSPGPNLVDLTCARIC
jgi:hypothetical protein